MLRHIVMFSWKDETAEKKIAEIERAALDLPKKIAEIYDFEWGMDESPEKISHGFTHCYFITFKTRADRDVYLPHPEHQAFVEMAKPFIKDVLVVDYWKR